MNKKNVVLSDEDLKRLVIINIKDMSALYRSFMYGNNTKHRKSFATVIPINLVMSCNIYIADNIKRYIDYARANRLVVLIGMCPDTYFVSYMCLSKTPCMDRLCSDMFKCIADYPVMMDSWGGVTLYNHDVTYNTVDITDDRTISVFKDRLFKIPGTALTCKQTTTKPWSALTCYEVDELFYEFDYERNNVTVQILEACRSQGCEWYDPEFRFYLEMKYPL